MKNDVIDKVEYLLRKFKDVEVAINVVDEILESKPSYNFWDTYSDEEPSAITFYREVKDELLKIFNNVETN